MAEVFAHHLPPPRQIKQGRHGLFQGRATFNHRIQPWDGHRSLGSRRPIFLQDSNTVSIGVGGGVKVGWDGGAGDRDIFCSSGGFYVSKSVVRAKVLERKVKSLIVCVPSFILINQLINQSILFYFIFLCGNIKAYKAPGKEYQFLLWDSGRNRASPAWVATELKRETAVYDRRQSSQLSWRTLISRLWVSVNKGDESKASRYRSLLPPGPSHAALRSITAVKQTERNVIWKAERFTQERLGVP